MITKTVEETQIYPVHVRFYCTEIKHLTQRNESKQIKKVRLWRDKEEVPVDRSMHGITEHRQTRGHCGEEALTLTLLRTTHLQLLNRLTIELDQFIICNCFSRDREEQSNDTYDSERNVLS